MEIQTTVADSIDAAEAQARLDAVCKRLLSEKIILAWIMKSCLEEYRNCTVEEIAGQYIEGEPEVSRVPLAPDAANGRIRGLNTEDTTMTESRVTYDVRFYALLPGSGEKVRMIINVEGQNRDYPGYPLVKRGVYYGGRQLSSQFGVEFTHADYGKVKKVCSIWVCFNPAQIRQNTVARYTLREEVLAGDYREKPENYDLLTVVMLYLGQEQSETDSDILRLLNVLFGTESDAARKKAYLSSEFGIPMTEKMNREVSEMCNYSEGILSKGWNKGWEQGKKEGMQQGIQQGMQQGMQQGKLEGQILSIASLVKDGILSLTDGAKRLSMTVTEFISKASELGCPVQ